MKEVIKFPNGGYDITIVRKEDIIATIDANITDKEVMMEIISQLEVDTSKLVSKGVWTGIPYMGSIRTPEGIKLNKTPEQRELLDDAFESLSHEKYVMFRHKLAVENDRQIRANRYYKYVTSIAARKNPKAFRKLSLEKGELYARIFFFSKSSITAVDNEYIPVENE